MPVRQIPRRGARKNIGKFFSVKTGLRHWYESLTEMDLMYLLDFDSGVVTYSEQPLRIRYVLDGKVRYYTPDLLVERFHKTPQIVEVKRKAKVTTARNDLLFRIVTPICEAEGFDFIVASDQMIRQQPQLDNVKALWRYARTQLHPQHQIFCLELFCSREVVSLDETFKFFGSKGIGKQVVYALLFWGRLSVDLALPLGFDSLITCPNRTATASRRVA